MFDPSVGQWIEQKDPSFEPNLYRYCGNDPVNYTDPSGLSRMEVDDMPDGRQRLLYVHTNWAGRAAYYVGSFSIGYFINRNSDQDMFESRPVFIGYYDPLTGNVQRGNNFVGVERVRREAESSLGGRPDWDAFFRDNAIDFDERRNMQGLAGRDATGINLDNRAVLARAEALEVGVQGAMAALPYLSALRLASPARLSIRGAGGPLRVAPAEAVTNLLSTFRTRRMTFGSHTF